jgi:hypothetical protein
MIQDEEVELYQNQKRLALSTIDDLTQLKIELTEADIEVPKFINNAIRYLKKKYLIQDQTIAEMLRTKS